MTIDDEHVRAFDGSMFHVGRPQWMVPESRNIVQESDAEYERYRKSLVRRMKWPLVLSAALRMKRVGELQLIREQSQPDDWLERVLVAEVVEDEFIRLSMSVPRSRETAILLNSIGTAFLDEVVNAETNRRVKKRSELERILAELEDGLASKRATLRKLGEALAPDVLEARFNRRLTDRLVQRLAEVEVELIEVSALEDVGNDAKPSARLARLKTVRTVLKARLDEIKTTVGSESVHSKVLTEDVERSSERLASLRHEIWRLGIELEAPTRVTLIRRAVAP